MNFLKTPTNSEHLGTSNVWKGREGALFSSLKPGQHMWYTPTHPCLKCGQTVMVLPTKVPYEKDLCGTRNVNHKLVIINFFLFFLFVLCSGGKSGIYWNNLEPTVTIQCSVIAYLHEEVYASYANSRFTLSPPLLLLCKRSGTFSVQQIVECTKLCNHVPLPNPRAFNVVPQRFITF